MYEFLRTSEPLVRHPGIHYLSSQTDLDSSRNFNKHRGILFLSEYLRSMLERSIDDRYFIYYSGHVFSLWISPMLQTTSHIMLLILRKAVFEWLVGYTTWLLVCLYLLFQLVIIIYYYCHSWKIGQFKAQYTNQLLLYILPFQSLMSVPPTSLWEMCS